MTFAEKGFWEHIIEGFSALTLGPVILSILAAALYGVHYFTGDPITEYFSGLFFVMIFIAPLVFAVSVVKGLWALVPYEVRGMIFWSLIIIPTGVAIYNLIY